jgi:uncharacterized SAM-binding protein YcdF (DUF218 family)
LWHIPVYHGMVAQVAARTCLADARILWDFHAVGQEVSAADVIVCLGSYDARVAVRCAELLRGDVAPVAVITGGYGNWTRGRFDQPEAAIFAAVIENHGIARARLILETKATNIGENVAFARLALRDRAIRRAILITKPQTQRRVWATARRQWPEVECTVTAPAADLLSQAVDEPGLTRLIEEMVGDVQRLMEYPAAGFQVAVEIPSQVLDAYRRLRGAGFDGHCLLTDGKMTS